jgi:hypothetical protein
VNEVIKAAAELQAVCEAEEWRFCFIGGLAVLRWGEPRETVDVDLSLLTGFSGEDRFVRTLLGRFRPRIENAAEFASTRMPSDLMVSLVTPNSESVITEIGYRLNHSVAARTQRRGRGIGGD